MVYEMGSKPEGKYQTVGRDYDVKAGEIYGAEVWFILSQDMSEEDMARAAWSNLAQAGDEPLYVRVEKFWVPWSVFPAVKAEFYAKHKSAGSVTSVLIGIALAAIGISLLLYVTYYIVTGKPVPPPTGTNWLLIGLILLGAYLLFREVRR